jgi:hypothetical protein
MASSVSTDKLFTTHAIASYDFDPNSTAATDVAWVDLRDYSNFAVIVMSSALTGNGPAAFKILANPNSDGSGTDVEVKAHAVGSKPDAVGDYLVLECTAEEIAELASDNSSALRYVSANIAMANAADEAVVTYIRTGARFQYDGMTADYVS